MRRDRGRGCRAASPRPRTTRSRHLPRSACPSACPSAWRLDEPKDTERIPLLIDGSDLPEHAGPLRESLRSRDDRGSRSPWTSRRVSPPRESPRLTRGGGPGAASAHARASGARDGGDPRGRARRRGSPASSRWRRSSRRRRHARSARPEVRRSIPSGRARISGARGWAPANRARPGTRRGRGDLGRARLVISVRPRPPGLASGHRPAESSSR